MRASVIVTTYNWPQALAASLESLSRQDFEDFEIIVADDGSTEETRRVVEGKSATSRFRIRHVWQPDQGFRAAAIRNKAIAAASGEYLVLIDGDCFVLPDFVANHLKLAEPGFFVSGKRSYLRQRLTRAVLDGGVDEVPTGRLGWFLRGMTNQCTRPLHFLDLPLARLRYRKNRDWEKVQTCNLGFFRSDAVAINGFDERYQGHGLEDSDFVVRLLRSGVQRKLGDFSSIVMHLEHPRRSGNASNQELFRDMMNSGAVRAERGLADMQSPA